MHPDSTTIILAGTPGGATAFARNGNQLQLVRLCGVSLQTQDLGLVCIDGRRYEGDTLVLETIEESNAVLVCRWRVGDTPVRLTMQWQGCPGTGIVSRCDTLTNTGNTPVILTRCLARVPFPSGHYTCYTQASRWCRENQGAWQPLHCGLVLQHAPGQTTAGTTPYLALRAMGAEQGVVFHVLPCGNWTIRVRPVTVGGARPLAVVELGLADENLHRVLAPGETFTLPEILFQPLLHGEPHRAAPVLHQYLHEHHFRDARPEAPIVYNTWFDQFEILDVPRLRQQLVAAQAVGCEVFVIDAGWYGAGGSNWWLQAGDWRERTDAAFCGAMQAFANEVRAAGLGFGIWMEPERFGPGVPVRAAHPEWFISVGNAARMDLTRPAAYAWLRGEMGRLVETYGLAWIKIDFNFTFDADATGAELADYTAAWYRLLDEVRAAYPETFFEGCSSGALRSDLAILAHFDGFFLSDSTNPVDMLRISQGAWVRLPPGRLTRWAVIRSAGQVLPHYLKRIAESPATMLVPGGALWEPAESADLNFVLLNAMPGMMGFSGDLAGLTPEHRRGAAAAVAFYKQWRRFIVGAVAHLLTPPMLMDCREGWIGFQLQVPGDDTSLVFVYCLGNAGAPPQLRLYGLDPGRSYTIQCGFAAAAENDVVEGECLMRDGLPPQRLGLADGRAAVFVVRADRVSLKKYSTSPALKQIASGK
jgi:alpha-galactosidase